MATAEPIKVEPRCPGCHGGDFADFDHYCDAAGIHDPAEFPAAFAAWMNALTGWDGPMSEASTPPASTEETAEEVHTDWCWSHCPVWPPYDGCECPCHRSAPPAPAKETDRG